MDSTHLTEDKDRWWAAVNIVMNCRVPQNAENFLTSHESVGLSRGLCSMENYLSSCLLHFKIQCMNIQ